MARPNPPAQPSRRVVIAGFGLLSPLGLSAWQTFSALLAGRTLADRAAKLDRDLAPVDLVRAVGAVGVAQHGQDDPAIELAERAAREACFMAGVDPAGLPTFLGASKGAVHALSNPAGAMSQTPLCVALGPHGCLAHRLRQRMGLGLVRCYVAACASSLVALHHAHAALARGASADGAGGDVALVVTAEASLTPLFIHSYRRLGVLAPLRPAAYRQRPLDRARGGFTLSETAAAVVLRRLPPGEAPRPGQIELVDTAVACEANDLIRPSPTMPALARLAASLLREPVDVIHPHAPGTADHDPVELAACADALRTAGLDAAAPPDLYAAKGALGHCLGAAGLTSLVVACLCLTTGRRPPMPWLTDPLPWPAKGGDAAPPADLAAPRPCPRHGAHLVLAAGFAGHVAGALIGRAAPIPAP